MEFLVFPGIALAILGIIAVFVGGIIVGDSPKNDVVGGLVLCGFGALVLAVSMTIFSLAIDPPNGDCKVGISPGTYEARVVNEVDGMARLLIEKGDEGDRKDDVKAAENTECRLVPVEAFRPNPPGFSTDPYTIEVTDNRGFTSITATH